MSAESGSRREGNDLKSDAVAVGLTALGAILLISLVYGGQNTGFALEQMSSAMRAMAGSGAYLVPVWILGLAIAFALYGRPAFRPRTVAGTLLVAAGILLALQLHANANWHTMFDEYRRIVSGGGYVGAAIAYVLVRLLGLPATYVILVAMFCLAALLISTRNVKDVLVLIGRGMAGMVRLVARVPKAIGDLASKLQSAEAAVAEYRDSSPRGNGVRTVTEGRGPHNPAGAGKQSKPPGFTDSEGHTDSPDSSNSQSSGGQSTNNSDADNGKSVQTDASADQPALMDDDDVLSLPDSSMLSDNVDDLETAQARQEAAEQILKLEDALASFDINCKVTDYERGPVLTRYEVEPERGTRVNKITRLADDIALALAAEDVRVEAPIPGKSAVGIEVPNPSRATVGLRPLLESEAYQETTSPLAFPLGRDIAGQPVVVDLARMPHLLIAGATGSGKSVCLHSLIISLLTRAKPQQLRFVLIDPKRVELAVYDGMPHLMSPVVHTVKEAGDVLKKVIREMEKRYDKFAIKGVINLEEYNELAREPGKRAAEEFDPFPRVVIVIDELADLMMQSRAEFEFSICRLAQLARATGIHLVLATQRPSVKVITGNIKANMPSRIALAVASQHDSRTILDGQGAEHLIGRGDMLYAPIDASQPQRMQGAFVPRPDIERIVQHLKDQDEPDFDIVPQVPDEEDFRAEAEASDELYAAAAEHVIGEQRASVSMLQRRFKIGYARAGRLIDALERRGIVGPHEGSKSRKVLVGPGMIDEALQGTHQQDAEDEQAAAPDDNSGDDETDGDGEPADEPSEDEAGGEGSTEEGGSSAGPSAEPSVEDQSDEQSQPNTPE